MAGLDSAVADQLRFLRGGAAVVGSANFTPAAAAYLAGDVIDVAKEITFRFADQSIVPPGVLIRVMSSVLKIAQTALIASEANYKLKLFSETPPTALADNDAWSPLAAANLAAYRGELDLGTPVDEGSACYVKTQFSDKQDFNLASDKQTLFGHLVTVGGVTFTAVARQVILYGIVV